MVNSPIEHQKSAQGSVLRSLRYLMRPSLAGAMFRYAVTRLRYPRLRVGFFRTGKRASWRIGPHARISFGRGVTISEDFTACVTGELRIGRNVFINRGCYIDAFESVVIGDDCLFGEWVSIHDMNHGIASSDVPFWQQPLATALVVIGNNVWAGAKVTILPGVTIGDNVIIGANAVVSRDIPANSLAVGVPARVVRTLTAEERPGAPLP